MVSYGHPDIASPTAEVAARRSPPFLDAKNPRCPEPGLRVPTSFEISSRPVPTLEKRPSERFVGHRVSISSHFIGISWCSLSNRGGDLALGETRSRGFFEHGMRLLVLGVLPNISSNIVGYRRDIVNLDARPGTADINPL